MFDMSDGVGCCVMVFVILIAGFLGLCIFANREHGDGYKAGRVAGIHLTKCSYGVLDSCMTCVRNGSEADQKTCREKLVSMTKGGK